jgi:hypothetical protein
MAGNVAKPGVNGGVGIWVCDTVADNIVAAGNFLKINKIRWVGSTTAADIASITDAGGTVPAWESGPTVAGSIAFTDESEFDLDAPLFINGLKVIALTHGKLYIYVGQ